MAKPKISKKSIALPLHEKPLSALGKMLAEQNEKTMAAIAASKVKLRKLTKNEPWPFATDGRARREAAGYAIITSPQNPTVWDGDAIQAAAKSSKKPTIMQDQPQPGEQET